ncbi:Holliday junction branch migration protein RuvA [Micrococcoides hystricis]|uniref:Holliday junction branch migration complex subunit RuvA n=1 Tax=Micrococcoides hystricis TaxID=1572761 RepID=A0ABV6P7J8_9MICC
MIHSLTGLVQHIGPSTVVLDINGVGMLVNTTPRALAEVRYGDELQLQTALIVREDALTLYGFGTADERSVFDTLLSVSGIGPKLALAMLALYEPAQIRAAVADHDDKALSKVPGVGPKTAKRIILELAGKLLPAEDAAAANSTAEAVPTASNQDHVIAALTTLGWSNKEAGAALSASLKANPELVDAPVDQILRRTLADLGQHTGTRAGARK